MALSSTNRILPNSGPPTVSPGREELSNNQAESPGHQVIRSPHFPVRSSRTNLRVGPGKLMKEQRGTPRLSTNSPLLLMCIPASGLMKLICFGLWPASAAVISGFVPIGLPPNVAPYWVMARLTFCRTISGGMSCGGTVPASGWTAPARAARFVATAGPEAGFAFADGAAP